MTSASGHKLFRKFSFTINIQHETFCKIRRYLRVRPYNTCLLGSRYHSMYFLFVKQRYQRSSHHSLFLQGAKILSCTLFLHKKIVINVTLTEIIMCNYLLRTYLLSKRFIGCTSIGKITNLGFKTKKTNICDHLARDDMSA